MTKKEICVRACMYAINELTRKGSTAFMTSSHDGRQMISWDEVVEWLNGEQTPILDKIRAEIEIIIGEHNLDDYDFCSGLICARKIIDKCKAESEGLD